MHQLHIHTHTHTHTCTLTRTRMHTHTHAHAHTHTYAHLLTHTPTHAHTNTYTRTHIHTHLQNTVYASGYEGAWQHHRWCYSTFCTNNNNTVDHKMSLYSLEKILSISQSKLQVKFASTSIRSNLSRNHLSNYPITLEFNNSLSTFKVFTVYQAKLQLLFRVRLKQIVRNIAENPLIAH